MTLPNLSSILETAQKLDQAEHRMKEQEKLGVLRAGNAGIALGDGNFAGTCARVTLLRLLGIEADPPSRDRLIMFDGGRRNEDAWAGVLDRAGVKYLREEEIPVSWTTPAGTRVTGRPDMVILGPDEKPLLGLEHKMVSAVSTAVDVTLLNKPKLDHIIQATHYSWQVGVPFLIVYTQYVDFHLPDWVKKRVGREGWDRRAPVQLSANGRDIKKILPGETIYELGTDEKNGRVQYRRAASADSWTITPVSLAGIIGFYQEVERMRDGGALGPRPLTLTATGDVEQWKKCNYCALQKICDKHEANPAAWLSVVKGAARI